MIVAEANQKNNHQNTPNYVNAILAATERKTCPNLAKAVNVSHDSIFRSLEQSDNRCSDLIQLAKDTFGDTEVEMKIDDTRLEKQYAELIEGADEGYDGSSHRPCMGLQIITAMLANAVVKIPIEASAYITKWLSGSPHLTKSDIAINIVNKFMYIFNISRIVADAHYATYDFISFLQQKCLSFLMKLPRNRNVTINGTLGQIQDLLKIKKNERAKCQRGLFEGLPCYFYVVKVDKAKTIYLISSDYIDPKIVYECYQTRWKIEVFHRASKQLLGLSECQTRSLEKQLQHCRFVMHAYALADIYRYQMGLPTTEEAIRQLRIIKQRAQYSLKLRSVQENEYSA